MLKGLITAMVLGAAMPGLAACTGGRVTETPDPANGWDSYKMSGVSQAVQCHDRPVRLGGSHTTISLHGRCPYVLVAGDHNDIDAEVSAASTIEIAGSHNDVTWKLFQVGTALPRLVDHGFRNTFHDGRF